MQPNLVLAQPMTLFISLMNESDERLRGLTVEEVEDALNLLSSRSIGVLRRTSHGSEGFVLIATSVGVRQRLAALVRTFTHASLLARDTTEPRRGFGQVDLPGATGAK